MIEVIPPGEIVEPTHKLPTQALHNYYHRSAQAAAAQAAHFAVLCGLELARLKVELSHVTNWQQWVGANCEFSYETGQRYIRVAEGIKGKALKSAQSAEAIALLETAPSKLDSKGRATLVQTVGKVTEGDTLRQLYLDFGIIKATPKDNLKRGGATHTRGSKPTRDLDAEDAEATVSDLLTSLARWFQSGSHTHLTKAKLQTLDQQLVAARETLAPFIK